MPLNSNQRGLLAAVTAPLFIAVSIIICNQAGKQTSPLVVACLGSLLSVPMLLIYHACKRSPMNFRALFTECRPAFLRVLVSRTIFGQALIVAGFAMTTAVKAVLLLRLEPLFVLFWAVLAHQEKLDRRKLLLLAILLGGTWMVVAPNSVSAPNIGDALIVASLVFLSYSYGPTGQTVKAAGAPALNIALSLCGGLALAMVASCVHGPAVFMIKIDTLSLIAQYSFIFFVVACSLYFFAFHTLKPWLIASVLSLEVVFGVILAVTWLHEPVTAWQLLGCLIVIAATVAIARTNQSAPEVLIADAIEDERPLPAVSTKR